MPIAMVRMLSVEISPPFLSLAHFPHVSHLVFSAMYGCFVWWSFNFPTFPAPTFSPFPFPLFPFPFPLSVFQSVFFLCHFCCSPIFPIAPLWCSKWFLFLCCHVSDCHRCCLLSTTGMQLFSKRGGFVFSVFSGVFFPWGGWKAPDSGGGGGDGWVRGGVSCEEFGVDNGGGGGDLGIVSPNFL